MNSITISSSSPHTSKVTTYQQPLFTHDSDKKRPVGYITADRFFEILETIYYSEHGENDHLHHPEDIYLNVSSILTAVCNTLNALIDIDHGRTIKDVRKL